MLKNQGLDGQTLDSDETALRSIVFANLAIVVFGTLQVKNLLFHKNMYAFLVCVSVRPFFHIYKANISNNT